MSDFVSRDETALLIVLHIKCADDAPEMTFFAGCRLHDQVAGIVTTLCQKRLTDDVVKSKLAAHCPTNSRATNSRAIISLSYVTLPFNVGRPFCLMDVSQWLHNLQPKRHKRLMHNFFMPEQFIVFIYYISVPRHDRLRKNIKPMQLHFNTQPLTRWRHSRITQWRVSMWRSCSYNSCANTVIIVDQPKSEKCSRKL